MKEAVFIIILTLLWMIFAVVQDLRKREIANWVNFSLIIFALGARFFYDVFNVENFSLSGPTFLIRPFSIDLTGGIFFARDFFIFVDSFLENLPMLKQGIYGLLIFFALGNIFYHARFFAGGDAKLMIALGTVLPFYTNFMDNLRVFFLFFLVFFPAGAVYGLGASIIVCARNFSKFKKKFLEYIHNDKRIFYLSAFLGAVFFIIGLFNRSLLIFGAVGFLLPIFYFFMKSIDEACMTKKIRVDEITEGDWLCSDIKIGKKLIKKSWDGLSKADILEIKKRHKAVLIKQGIPFSPVFLISFLILIYLSFFVFKILREFL